MRILVSNDDGIESPGIQALAEALQSLGEVFIVAPDREQSAASHAISLHRPLRLHRVRERQWAVDGTPTDCVYLAMNHILKDTLPEMVVSGINRGSNLADDVTYSGTVAAAMEGALFGVPAIAFSLATRTRKWDFAPAAAFARKLVETVIARPLPRGALLNVNIPDGAPTGFAITRLGKRSYGQVVAERRDPRGRAYYWIGGDEQGHEDIPGSDCNAVYDEGKVSITPLHLDLTHTRLLEELHGLEVAGYAGR
jgi:5'-nucleotidase